MAIRRRFRPILLCAGWLSAVAGTARPDEAALAGPLSVQPERIVLSGAGEAQQLVVTEITPDGRPRDCTREAVYHVEPPGVIRVDDFGFMRAEAKGDATVRISAGGRESAVRVSVTGAGGDRPVHFANDIVPLLTRSGCNSGGCHGKASGQNGFKLSLLGFDPDADLAAIVKEGRGRRVFPCAPDHSLLLEKATARVPHGGGRRLDPDGDEYAMTRRWIAQGTPAGDPKAPTLANLEVIPRSRVMNRQALQQLAVLAHYSDGSVRDVTRQAQWQSNQPAVAAVEPDGLVRALDQCGEAAVMVRYMGEVAVFLASVPIAGAGSRSSDFRPANFIDTLALAKWNTLGLTPSEACTDPEFARRVFLDLCGRLPTVDELRVFLSDRGALARSKLIDSCLASPDHAAFMAQRWGTLLRNAASSGMKDGSEPMAYAFHNWIREMIASNRPYDEFVRGIVAADGEWQDAPPVQWYYQMSDDPLHQPVADTAQVFLGLRIQCARCHHHPFERWGQDDYYGLAGFFTRVARKDIGSPAFYSERTAVSQEVHPRTGKPIEPKLLGGRAVKVAPENDPRHALVDWMVRPDNPYFARAYCNRVWGHFFGRGLVDPVDDMRATNPPSNAELLEALGRDFVTHKFDVRHLFRTICNSRTYQLSAVPNETNTHDRQNHARFYARRLLAEVLHDAVDQACGTRTEFNKMPKQARAVDLPHESFDSYFLDVFNRPNRGSSCECTSAGGASLSQVLHLANSPEIEDKISADGGRVARLSCDLIPPAKAIEELYLATFSRQPTPHEMEKALKHVSGVGDRRRGLENLLWALLNSREFLFNH